MERILSHRTLGTAAMVTAPLLLVSVLLARMGYVTMLGRADGLLGILYICGWLGSAIGLWKVGAISHKPWAKAIFAIQLTALALAAIWSGLLLVRPFQTDGILFAISDPAWPFSHAFMLVAGIAVLASGTWRGWRRFTPLIFGLGLPVAFLVWLLAERPEVEITFGIYSAIAGALLGYALLSTPEPQPVSSLRYRPSAR